MRKDIKYHSVQRESTKDVENSQVGEKLSEQNSVNPETLKDSKAPKNSKPTKEKLKEIKKIFTPINGDRND